MMEWIHTIKPISWGLLGFSAFFAVMNGMGFWQNIRYGKSISYVPFAGFIFFFFGTLGWDEPIYFWLLALLDIGTITGFLGLPFLIKELFSQSIFTHFATFQNKRQIIKLYKTKHLQTFSWRYTAKIPLDYSRDKPRPCGCGGDWQIQGNQLTLTHGNEVIAVGELVDDQLIFNDKIDLYYELLQNAQLTKK